AVAGDESGLGRREREVVHRRAVIEHELQPADPDARHRDLAGLWALEVFLQQQSLEVGERLAVELARFTSPALEHQERCGFHRIAPAPGTHGIMALILRRGGTIEKARPLE